MAHTRDSLLRVAARAAIAGVALASVGHAQNEASRPEQINLSADSWTRSGDTYRIPGLVIEGGDLRIEADEALTTSLEVRGRWQLSGSVRMTVGTARLLADSAVFEFADGALVRGELSGSPATFEETEPGPAGPIRGEAMRLVFDAEAGTVQMQGEAAFTMGGNSMSGCDFVYDLDGGLESGSNECGVPLSISYRLGNASDAADEAASGDDESTEGRAPSETPSPP